MKPFRKNVAIAVDGGGIKGIIVARALSMLEDCLGKPIHDIFRLAAGTSTGSIISAGLACGLTAHSMFDLYTQLGNTIFPKTLRSLLWPITRYRYPNTPLVSALEKVIGDKKMGDFWTSAPQTDVVLTTFDLVDNHTHFVKPWKDEYKDWPVVRAVLASSSVPTYFPIVEGRYVDGGVGSYANPCYLAAYEINYCLDWDPAETTLISLGTGRDPHKLQPYQADRYLGWQWLSPVLGAFLQSADDQQVNLVKTFFDKLDFRRFQVNLQQPFDMDDPSKIPQLTAYGEEMGRMIQNDIYDSSLQIMAARVPVK
ncbi:MAG: patatin-like phospholipase family protein [Anaerolineaceae bacterium]|nr:patatin-like phospholipase family protein [Anaerolineaceae bacterium]